MCTVSMYQNIGRKKVFGLFWGGTTNSHFVCRPENTKGNPQKVVIGYAVSYILIILLGLEHQVLLHCCDCEPVTVTMVRARMWPASPQYPRLAFSFEMMDWVEAILLECQVAVKEFCGALYFKCPNVIGKVCYIALL